MKQRTPLARMALLMMGQWRLAMSPDQSIIFGNRKKNRDRKKACKKALLKAQQTSARWHGKPAGSKLSRMAKEARIGLCHLGLNPSSKKAAKRGNVA